MGYLSGGTSTEEEPAKPSWPHFLPSLPHPPLFNPLLLLLNINLPPFALLYIFIIRASQLFSPTTKVKSLSETSRPRTRMNLSDVRAKEFSSVWEFAAEWCEAWEAVCRVLPWQPAGLTWAHLKQVVLGMGPVGMEQNSSPDPRVNWGRIIFSTDGAIAD